MAMLAGGGFAVIAAALQLAPRGAWLYLVLATALLFGLLVRSGWRFRDSRPPTPTAIGLLAFGALAVAGEFWAAAPGEPSKAGAIFLAQTGLAIVAADCIARLPSQTVRQLGQGLIIGFLIGLAFVLFEAVTKLALHRLIYNTFPMLTPGDDQHFHFVRGRVVTIDISNLKRNMAASALLLWPVLLLLGQGFAGRIGWWQAPALAAAAGVTAVLSTHESSVLAFFAALLVLPAAKRWFLVTWRVSTVVWCVLTLLIVPIMLWEFNAKLYENAWLQPSARHRLAIWGYSAEQVFKAPILGIGAGSGRVLDDQRTDIEQVPGQPFSFNTANHQHDVYLQTWYEMGGLGALVLALAGLMSLWRLQRMPQNVRGYALATFVSVMAMASTSYGLWQEWFEAAMAFSAIMLVLAIRIVAPATFDLPPRPAVEE